MKNYVSILLTFVLLSCGQSKVNYNKPTLDTITSPPEDNTTRVINKSSSVEDITMLYAELNDKLHEGMLDSVSINYDCSGERSGIVTYFYEGVKLIIIKHSYSEYSHFSATDEYFISNDRLFFAHQTGVSWSFESGNAASGATKDNITERRFYIAQESPLLCLEKRYERKGALENSKPETVKNKVVDCKNLEPVLNSFIKLIKFNKSSSQDCLGK